MPRNSSWRSIVGRTDNALKNQINAAENGIKYGALGYLNTDWGDSGQPQHLISSYAPYTFGAAVSWSLEDNRALDINNLLNRYIYKDQANKTSQIIYDLGNVNQVMNPNDIFNMSFFHLLKDADQPLSKHQQTKYLTIDKLTNSIEALESIIARTSNIKATAKDAHIVQREIKNAAKLAIHACNLGIEKLKSENGNMVSIASDVKHKLTVELMVLLQNIKKSGCYEIELED